LRAFPKFRAGFLRRPEGRYARLAFDIGQLAIGLLIGVLLFDRIVMPRVVRQGWDTTVPDLRGATKENGEALLHAAKLRAGQVLEVADPEVAAGKIISQDPPAGSRVRKGRLVLVLLSQGTLVREIPDLAGKTLRSARLDLMQQGLKQGTVLVLPSESVPVGEVIGTHPQRGAMPHRDGSVDLLVSGGQHRTIYLMPDLRGIEMRDAAGRLRAAGIAVDSSSVGSQLYVSAQDPAPGEPVATGQRASLN
jgi:eukaryotic-like serine/threonine-protein kinase